MNKKIAIPQKLAGNPPSKPQFSRDVKSSLGIVTVADPRATRAMVSLMDMNAVLGGAACHFGGPSALAEIMSSLFALVFREAEKKNQPWFDLFHIVNDVGHAENGLYALKANYKMAGLNLESLKKFRSVESGLTGHGEVHCFPEGVFLSNGPLGSAFPQAQGLAVAEKISGEMRTTVCVLSDGAAMEGEAKEAFAAVPGLASKNQIGPFVLILSDNNTKLTGRIDQDSYSMAPTFEALKTLGWDLVLLEKAHDLESCIEALAHVFEKVRNNPSRPVALHCKTIKGFGIQKLMDSASGGHGFPLKSSKELPAFLNEIYKGEVYPQEFSLWIEDLLKREGSQPPTSEGGEKIQKGISSAMIKAHEAGLPVFSVTSDLPGSTGVADFRKKFPQSSLDVGVAESNMISVAVGLSKSGYIPVVDTFAQFGVTKGALPLTMASLSQAPMICIFSHTGFQDAADGASHQALSYVAMTSSIPHIKVHALTCSEEAESLMSQALLEISNHMKTGSPAFTHIFFLGRENFPKNFGSHSYHLYKPQVIRENLKDSSTMIVAVGSLVGEALKACDQLDQQGKGYVLVNPGCLNQIDLDFFKEQLRKTKGHVVTVEDHQLIGGYGQILTHALVSSGEVLKLKSLAVRGEFGQSAYNAIDLYRKHGLDSKAILDAVSK